MNKTDFLAKLNANKDKPIIIGMADEGQVVYSGIPGHWLFVSGDNLVSVRKVTNRGTYGVAGITQQQHPYSVYTAPIEYVNYVETFIPAKPGEIVAATAGLTPAGTSKTLEQMQAEMQSDDIMKALTPRGFQNVEDVAPDGSYGKFRGTAVSTTKEGLPKYMDSLID